MEIEKLHRLIGVVGVEILVKEMRVSRLKTKMKTREKPRSVKNLGKVKFDEERIRDLNEFLYFLF